MFEVKLMAIYDYKRGKKISKFNVCVTTYIIVWENAQDM